MPQDGTGSKWPGFLHIPHCLQANKGEWEPRRKTQQMVTDTICTPRSSQSLMKPELRMNGKENSKVSLFHLFHTIGIIPFTPHW